MTDSHAPDQRTNELVELLHALVHEARTGRLKTITFALVDSRMPENAVIDHWGSPDITEIACRKTVERIAATAELFNPVIARAIRDGMPAARKPN